MDFNASLLLRAGIKSNTHEGFAREAGGEPAHFKLLKSDLLPLTMLKDYAQPGQA